MDRFVIEGGRPLSGEIGVMAAKNAVLPILAASIMAAEGETVLRNIPAIQDVATLIKLMGTMGVKAHFNADNSIKIDASGLKTFHADYDLVRRMRASVLVMGPLLARMGKCEVSLPGGCNIGARPIDQHLKGFEQMGVTFEESEGYIIGTVGELQGGKVYFDRPTHTGTENIMMAAVMARGTTEIINASCEPEVKDLADFLIAMGAKIKGAGTPYMIIEGVDTLTGVEYRPMGDRLEAGTYLLAAMATRGDIKIEGIRPIDLGLAIRKMEEMGAEITTTDSSVALRMLGRPARTDVITMPFPGFPTDLQPMVTSVLALGEGTSYLRETVFENRFLHTMELARLGADIRVQGDTATIDGVPRLKGAAIMASDIRGGAGLVVAGLAAEGITEVMRVYHIDRGYDRIEKSLTRLGARIQRVNKGEYRS